MSTFWTERIDEFLSNNSTRVQQRQDMEDKLKEALEKELNHESMVRNLGKATGFKRNVDQ